MFSYSDKFTQSEDVRDKDYFPVMKLMRSEWNLQPHLAAMLARSIYWRNKVCSWTKERKIADRRWASDASKLKKLRRLLRTGGLTHPDTTELAERKIAQLSLRVREAKKKLVDLNQFRRGIKTRTKLYLPHFIFGGMLE